MAVPSITSLDPNHGLPAGGYRVVIHGSNFRTPDVVETPDHRAQESVRVYVDGEQVDRNVIRVISDSMIEITSWPSSWRPFSDFPVNVDVMIENVDSNGVPIPGESVTMVNAFEYRHVDLTDSSFASLRDITHDLIEYYKRNFDPSQVDVVLHTSPDYNPDSETWSEEPKTKGLIFVGPTLEPSRLEHLYQRFETAPDPSNMIVTVPRVVDVSFDVIGWSDSIDGLFRLMGSFMRLTQLAPDFRVTFNGHEIDVRLYLTMEPENQGLMVPDSGVQQFRSRVTIKGVPVPYIERERLLVHNEVNIDIES